MEKITLTIDLTKLDKSRITERSYTNSQGEQVTVKEYKMDVVPMKPENHKTISSGDTWALVKKYFVTDNATKEERQAQTKSTFLGEGMVFVDMQPQKVGNTNVDYPTEPNPVDPPF